MNSKKEHGISIIILTHNRREDLIFSVGSLLVQECSVLYEIIIIDQASEDGTSETDFVNERVQLIRLKKNLGVAGGRNKGAQLAQYEKMLFLDDDAGLLSKDTLYKVYLAMEKYSGYDIFAFQIINRDGGLYNWPYRRNGEKNHEKIMEVNKFIGCGHAVRKTLFDKLGGYNSLLFFWGEETQLVMKNFATGRKPVLYCGDIIIQHRVTNCSRIQSDERFFYQVRNRLWINREMLRGVGRIYSLYFLMGYWVKACRHGQLRIYKKAIKEALGKDFPKSSVVVNMSTLQLLRYLTYN